MYSSIYLVGLVRNQPRQKIYSKIPDFLIQLRSYQHFDDESSNDFTMPEMANKIHETIIK